VIAAELRAAVEWKVLDPHMSEAEVAGMWTLVEKAQSTL